MKAARLHAINDFRIDEIDIPKVTDDSILVKVSACGICGSDIPRVFTLGTSKQKYPLTIGHEFAGEIVKVGKNVDTHYIGRKGSFFPLIPCRKCDPCISGNYAMCNDYDYMGSRCDGGFAEYVLVPSIWNFVESKNNKTPDTRLAMCEPATVAQHAIRKVGLVPGESIVIFGAGPIGIMTARWAKIFGAKNIVLVDIDDDKVKFANEHGVLCLNSTHENFISQLKATNAGNLFDRAIEGTGAGNAWCTAIDIVKPFATIALLGNPFGDSIIPLKEHSTILRKELGFVGCWNSHYSNLPINEWHYTIDMMDKNLFVCEDLITTVTDLDKLPKVMEDIYHHKIKICKAMFVKEK